MTGGHAAGAGRQAGQRPHFGRIGLGTGPLGGLYAPVNEEDAQAALETAWAQGIRYFDTAPHYGAGLAERRLGRFLRDRPRAQAVVSTKVGRLLVPGAVGAGEHGFHGAPAAARIPDYSRDGVHRSLADSLVRTGLDRFDLVLIHDPDEHWEQAVDHAYPALAQLRDQGVVGAIGVGMNQAEMLTRFVRQTDIDVVLVAGRYTLLDRRAEAELLPLCRERGVDVLVGGVFNSGVLANPEPGAFFDYRPASQPILRRAQAMRDAAWHYGIPLTALALQFPLRHPAVTAVLIGARHGAEVAEDVAMAALTAPAELWTQVLAL